MEYTILIRVHTTRHVLNSTLLLLKRACWDRVFFDEYISRLLKDVFYPALIDFSKEHISNSISFLLSKGFTIDEACLFDSKVFTALTNDILQVIPQIEMGQSEIKTITVQPGDILVVTLLL